MIDADPLAGGDGWARVGGVTAAGGDLLPQPGGFEGHGVDSFVDNGRVLRASQTDILTNEATGQRFRAHSQFVLDLATDTVRVERGELICLGP